MTQATILGTKLAFIIAHPDDESYLAAGTIHKNQAAGGESFVICATAGERGKAHLDHPVSAAELKNIRQQELEAAARLLHVRGLIQLGLPDGQVEQHQTQLDELVKHHLTDIQPDYIISFDQDGVSGHIDHITVGAISKKLSKKLNLPYLGFCRPSSLSEQILKKRRRFGVYKEEVPHQEPNLTITVDPEIKLSALSCHVSQMEHNDPLANFPETVKEQLLHYEYFYADWL